MTKIHNPTKSKQKISIDTSTKKNRELANKHMKRYSVCLMLIWLFVQPERLRKVVGKKLFFFPYIPWRRLAHKQKINCKLYSFGIWNVNIYDLLHLHTTNKKFANINSNINMLNLGQVILCIKLYTHHINSFIMYILFVSKLFSSFDWYWGNIC